MEDISNQEKGLVHLSTEGQVPCAGCRRRRAQCNAASSAATSQQNEPGCCPWLCSVWQTTRQGSHCIEVQDRAPHS